MPDFVKAYDTVTGRKVVVPAHFLGPASPFPNLKQLPSERDTGGKKTTAKKAAAKTRRPSGKQPAPAQAAAATDKEK